jgi:hypothetical protein
LSPHSRGRLPGTVSNRKAHPRSRRIARCEVFPGLVSLGPVRR